MCWSITVRLERGTNSCAHAADRVGNAKDLRPAVPGDGEPPTDGNQRKSCQFVLPRTPELMCAKTCENHWKGETGLSLIRTGCRRPGHSFAYCVDGGVSSDRTHNPRRRRRFSNAGTGSAFVNISANWSEVAQYKTVNIRS